MSGEGGQPAAAAICPTCGLFITGAFWPDDQSPTAAEHLAEHQRQEHPLRNGDCGYGVVPEEWHHGVAGPPMTDTPADRCER